MSRRWTPSLVLLLVFWTVTSTSAAVFQYHLDVPTAKKPSEAFLWIPPQCERIRGVVMAGMTLAERPLVKDSHVRAACAEQDLAIVFSKCGLGAVDIPQVLAQFADKSGYAELANAPAFFLGHSAGGPQAKRLSNVFAGVCFGVMLYRGGWPGDGESPVPAGVPCLLMIGQFDEFAGQMRDEDGLESWSRSVTSLIEYRQANPAHLCSIVVEPGAGHFAWSERNAKYFAAFLKKVAEARIPDPPPSDPRTPVTLKEIDPESGWLTELDPRVVGANPTDYENYSGDPQTAAWHFDEEMARATHVYHEPLMAGKRDQFIKWQDPVWVDAGARFFFTSVKWVDDGRTFEVHPVYADAYPSQHNGHGPRWPKAGEQCGHSDAPIRIKPVGGPLEVVAKNRFRLVCDNLSPATELRRPTFMAFSEGDDKFRHTEQVGMLPRSFKGMTRGEEQTITFKDLPDMRATDKPRSLIATSSAGLPVDFYVAYGPAKVENGRLVIAELPAKARLPIEVKVVAYQVGRGIEPLVQTAEPVEKTLNIK